MLYWLNNTPSSIPNSGSNFSQFFGRRGKVPKLPSVASQPTAADIRKQRVVRENFNRKVATEKKRSDPQYFQIGDPVILRTPGTSKWGKAVLLKN